MHPLLIGKDMDPVDVAPAAVIGKTSLPTSVADGDWHSGAGGVVVVLDAVVVTVTVDVTVELEEVVWVDVDVVVEEEVELVVSGTSATCAGADALAADTDWFFAYAAIPPETRTSIAATVRSWSLPLFTCMFVR